MKFALTLFLGSIFITAPAMADEYLSCDLSVTEVMPVMDFDPDYGKYKNTWDNPQWFSVYASNKGVVKPKDRLEKEQFKDMVKDGYDYYYDGKMVQTSIPDLDIDDTALAVRQGSWFDIERSGTYALIKSKPINKSLSIEVLVYRNNKLVLNGRTIMTADKNRVSIFGDSLKMSELKQKHSDLDEIELFQMLEQGELSGFMMSCQRW